MDEEMETRIAEELKRREGLTAVNELSWETWMKDHKVGATLLSLYDRIFSCMRFNPLSFSCD